ncbi:MAG: transcriptional repressor [Victivallaceae bacterium]|nr:transcriptional repressor [Victivallaceae bacterium]
MNKTIQREAILNELRSVTSHHTADELYAALRPRMPLLSLGTVYRNLEQMSQAGLILKLETAGRQKRFDGNLKPHNHLRCRRCGAVSDVSDVGLDSAVERLGEAAARLGADGFVLELNGLCEKCRLEEDGKK